MSDTTSVHLKAIASALVRIATDNELDQWLKVDLHASYNGRGGLIHTVKLFHSDGTEMLIDPSDDELDFTLLDLNKYRKDFGTEWFGFDLSVAITGKCSVDFDYSKDTVIEPEIEKAIDSKYGQ